MTTKSLTGLRLSFLAVLMALCIGASPILHAQSYLSNTGSPISGAPYPVEMGTVDAGSGNLHLEIPLGSFPQRGGSTTKLSISYDSHIWSVQAPLSATPYWMPYNAPLQLLNGGWYVGVSGDWLATLSPDYPSCDFDQEVWEPNGTPHWFHVILGGVTHTLSSGCPFSSTNTYAIDSSGFELFVTYQNNPQSYLTFTLYAPDGTLVLLQQSGGSSNPQYPKDANGNYMSFAGSAAGTDTLGRQILQTPISPASCVFTSVHPGGQYYACYNVLTSQGTSSYQQYILAFADIPLKTNFGWSGVAECSTNCWTTVLTGITLPDATTYSFKYDCDSTTGNAACNSPGSQTAYYGTLTQMTLPTGEQITYVYTMFGGVSCGNNHNQFPTPWLAYERSSHGNWAFTPAATAGAGPANNCLPNYQVGCMQTTVTRPDNSFEINTFIVDPLGGSYPQAVGSYDTDGTLLSTVSNTWDFSTTCTLYSCYLASPGPPHLGYQNVGRLSTSTTVAIPGGNLTKKSTYTYDTPQTRNLIAVKEWKYQNGTSPTFLPTPDRATYITYATIGTNNNINRPTSITVCNNAGTDSNCSGGGTTVARTTVTYDGYGGAGGNCLAGLTSIVGVVHHDDASFGCSFTARGNPTQISQWISATGAVLNTFLTYDTTGQVLTSKDSAGNITSYSYAPDNFYNDNGADPATVFTPTAPTNAHVVKVTDNIGSTTAGYYYGTGKLAVNTDYDGAVTYAHYMDPLDRPTQTDYPIGWVLNQYHSPVQGQTEVDSYAPVGYTGTASSSCTSCMHSQSMLDALGRVVTDNLVNNPAGQVSVSYGYDSLNRVISTIHPNFGSTDPNNVQEVQAYDGFGRSLGVTHPDNQHSRMAYGPKVATLGGMTTQQSATGTYGYGFPVVSTDEAGKQRQEWLDGFGHVIEVDELIFGATTTPSSGTLTINFNSAQEGGVFTIWTPQGTQQITVYNGGQVSVTVNGFTANAQYGPPPALVAGSPYTPQYIASELATALNVPNSPVTAVANSSSVTLTSVATGFNSNYAVTLAASYNTASCPTQQNQSNPCFTGPSYYASGLTALSGGTGGGSSPVVTSYTYDALGNLTGVVQGAQSRSWSYDGLSRLKQEVTPEAGTVTLSYVNTSGVPCSGDSSTPCTRIAPKPNQTGSATVTTTYTYDSANRLTQKSYSDNASTVTYTYKTVANGKGLLATMTDPSGSETYTYDTMKRVIQVNKKVGATNYPTSYLYNPGGELTRVTYPSGRAVYYYYDNVGHLCQVSNASGLNCNAATVYLTLPSAQYDAAGRPLSATYGNGVVATTTYDPNSFALTSLKYSKGATTLFGLNYYYQRNSTNCPAGNAVGNNGQIQCIADTVQPGRSVAYTYDSIGRLLSAATAGSTQYPAWGLSETYDRYSNRTAQGFTVGTGFNTSLSINPANNQVTTFSYDAAGNVTSVPSPTVSFTYDHEECNTGYVGNGSNATYTCDGNGLRVQKVVTGTNAVNTVYVRSGGQVLAEYDGGAAVASPTREYLYANNLLATVTGSTGGSGGTITYEHRDHLSPRLFTDVNGNDVGEEGAFPFGESWYSSSAAKGLVFTSYERDAESGNDYALARSYADAQGRFLAPDPLEGRVGDPQSWNRYAYVENDPINLSDPSGEGFWSSLGFAIADLFAAILLPEALPALGVVEGSEGAGMTIAQAIAIAQASGLVVIDVLKSGGKVKAVTLGCASGPCAQSSSPGPQYSPDSGGATDPSSTGNNPGGQGDPGGQGPGSGGGAAGGGVSSPSGGDIWNECESCWGALRTVGNFSAGAGEFLTAGLTSWINKKTGAAVAVDTNSRAYKGGFWTGAGLSVAIPLTKASEFGEATVKVWRYKNAGGFGVNLFPKGEALRQEYRIAVEIHQIARGGGLVPHLDVVWDGIKLLGHWPW